MAAIYWDDLAPCNRWGMTLAQTTRAELLAENRALKTARRNQGLFTLLNNLVRWGGVVLITRYIYLAIAALAGSRTFADISINFLGNLQISALLAWGGTAGAIIYGLRQRKLKHDTIEHLHRRIRELELRVDPRRSSSKLTERGETRPEDRV
jgi:hypothetical protein